MAVLHFLWYGIFLKEEILYVFMEVMLNIFIVITSCAIFATISYFLVKSTFTRIENDELEPEVLPRKKEAKLMRKKYTQLQKSLR